MSVYLVKKIEISYFVAFFGLAICVGSGLPQTVCASSKAETFLESIKGTHFDLEYLNIGLSSVTNISSFPANDPGSYALYYPPIDLMRVPASALDSDHNIKPLEQLSEGDLTSITHEAFHVYRAKMINLRESLSANRAWMSLRSKELFLNVRRDRREQVLEEAYAIYIERVITVLKDAHDTLSQEFTDPKSCRIQTKRLSMRWDDMNSDEISSDYRRDSLFDYVGDGFRFLLGMDITRIVNVEKPIELKDKLWVQQEILGSSFLRPFNQIFAQDLARISCQALASK